MRGGTAGVLGLIAGLGAAGAQERDRCADFAWPLAAERSMLAEAPMVENGGAVPLGQARRVATPLLAEANLPAPPERRFEGAESIRAAFVTADTAASRIQITLSDDAWVDVVQDGRYLRSLGSTGHRGCPGLRKSVRFDTGGAPFVIQVSGPDLKSVAIAVTPGQ
jgi:hypothetical protein